MLFVIGQFYKPTEMSRQLPQVPSGNRRVEKPFAKNELVLKTKGTAPIGSSMSSWPFFMNFRGPEAHGDRPQRTGVCASRPNFIAQQEWQHTTGN
jgi:hypothetical protein